METLHLDPQTIEVYDIDGSHLDTSVGYFDVSYPISRMSEETVIVTRQGDVAVVGYYSYDEYGVDWSDVEDCYGRVLRRGRDADLAEEGEFQDALGLDSDWEPNIEPFEDEAEMLVIRDALLECFQQFGRPVIITSIRGDPYPDGRVFFTGGPGDYHHRKFVVSNKWEGGMNYPCVVLRNGISARIPDREPYALKLWSQARKDGKIGNPWAVLLDVYDHSGVTYSVQHEGMQCPWDTTPGGALWVPSDVLVQDIESLPLEQRRDRAIELARQCARVYTDWANGWTYYTAVESFRRVPNSGNAFDTTEDEWIAIEGSYEMCGGYIGTEDADQALKSSIQEMLQYYMKEIR